MGIPIRDCYKLYNVGKSIEWQKCMGVEPIRDTQIKENDDE